MENGENHIMICLGSSCYSRGNADNLKIIKQFIQTHPLKCEIDFRGHLCKEHCSKGPVIEINGKLFEAVLPNMVEKLLLSQLVSDELIRTESERLHF